MRPTMLCKSRFARRTEIVRQRLLPGSGTVLAQTGDQVEPDDIVAKQRDDGQIMAVDLASSLGTNVRNARRACLVSSGQDIVEGQIIATRGKLFPRHVKAPATGCVQAIEDGYVFVRQAPTETLLRAYIPGHVTEHYPHRGIAIRIGGTLVGGVWGCGPETCGMLVNLMRSPDERLTYEHVGLRYRSAILMGGVLDDPRVIHRARQFQLSGLVVGSLAPELTSLCQRSGLTIVVTEGMGHLAMAQPVYEALAEMHGRLSVMSGQHGSTSHGPELIVPFAAPPASQALTIMHPIGTGTLVRLTRSPYMGMIGQVISVPKTMQETVIGTLAEGANVRLADGRQVFAPFVNMESLD